MKKMITIGRIGAPFGVRGQVKVQSFTEPFDNALNYLPWYIQEGKDYHPLPLEDCRPHGNLLIAKIEGCDDRDQAKAYTHKTIAIENDALPTLSSDEFYWHQLEGLTVVTTTGETLGKVDHLIATGSNDVLVVKGEREHMIPYTDTFVLHVSLKEGTITVDWDSHEI